MSVVMPVNTNNPSEKAQRRRGCLFYMKRILLALVALLIVILTMGIVYQTIAEANDKQIFMPPGELFDVNGHKMHLYCQGEGSPTIVLEAGAFSFSSEWYWVQRQLAVTNRVCAYDRPGNGWSEPGPAPRDGVRIARELHQLLQHANEPAPYILVGHSLGGLLAAIYVAEYPDEALGVVVVDSAIPLSYADKSAYEQWKSQNDSAYGLMATLIRVGAGRIIISREFQGYGYPSNISAELTAFKSTLQAVDAWDAEFRQAQWELGQQVSAAHDLGRTPLVILWASHPELVAAEERTILETIWESMPLVSANRSIRIVEGADHGSIVGNEQYALQVSDAVLDVIESIQTGSLLAP